MKISDHMPQEQPPQGLPPARGAMPEERGAEKPTGAQQKEGGDDQEAYERIILAASDVLYSEESMPAVLEQLQAGADDPAKAIADVSVHLIGQLDEQSQGTIPEDLIIPAVEEISGLVAELGQAKGLFQVDEQVLGRAGQHVLIGIAELYGEPTEEDMQDILGSVEEKDLQQIVQQQSQFSVV